MKHILVFDVESASLFGSAFAVGAIVAEADIRGEVIEVDRFELLSTEGALKASEWVRENVLPSLTDMPTCSSDRELRERFFEFLMKHKDTCEVWSDVGFPVEANFLAAIAVDDMSNREFLMPYPLKDIATIVPVDVDRNEEVKYWHRLRKHNPLDDAIASLNCLRKYLREDKREKEYEKVKIFKEGEFSAYPIVGGTDGCSHAWRSAHTLEVCKNCNAHRGPYPSTR